MYLKAICNLFCKIVKTLSFAGFLWYNIERYYTSADSLSTAGRKISTANHAHPPEGKRINALSMDEGHGIMSVDIIPAPVRRPTKGRTWYNIGRINNMDRRASEMQQDINSPELIDYAENGIGNYIRMNREAMGYSQSDLCDGICSVPTLSLIESGEKITDFWVVEALLERMKIEKTEYEFILDDNTCDIYEFRETIKMNIQNKEYGQAEKNLAVYREKYGEEDFHGQFLFFQKASLERAKTNPDISKKKELFLNALTVTAPNYKEIFERKGVMSNLELECIAEIIHCIEDLKERELTYRGFYEYFQWNCIREGFFPPAYRIAMQYYAECLYGNEKYEDSIKICDEALEELYGTSKVANRARIFILRAKARERKGLKDEEEKQECLRDYLTAYTVISFYEGEEEAKELKKYIKEKYGWQFID